MKDILIYKGFTLIELLVVISIIGILIALSFFGFQGARETARDAKRKSDLESIRSALELYKADCDAYPASLSYPIEVTGDATCSGGAVTYLEAISDPVSGREYSYVYTAATGTYVMCASLESIDSRDPSCAAASCGENAVCSYSVKNP